MTAVSERPLRRDAAENRQRLLDAATEVFAEHGLEAGVEEIARVAGVGMGTLYRRFPTKQDLIDTLVGDMRRELAALARAAATATNGRGLEQLLVSAGELQAGGRGCLSRLWDHSDAELGAMTAFRSTLRQLLIQAQAAGRVRTDVVSTDVWVLMWSLRGVIETTRAVAPNAWRRHLELMVAGLRPARGRFASELGERPLSEADARRVTSAGRVAKHRATPPGR
jgi:AcrR family transcriptional regulator